MLKKQFVFIVLVTLLVITGCSSKKNQTTENSTTEVEYPYTLLPDTIATNISDTAKLYPVLDELKESFLEKAGDFSGRHLKARVSFPEDWGVLCVERLSDGRDLMLLQSKSREWKYLLITSGYGTQRILDLMPVAVNVAQQYKDVLETEVWRTVRKHDGSFLLQKDYEWTRSVTNATRQQVLDNPQDYHRKESITEQFVINENGRFEIVEEPDTIPEYSAVVFFYNRNEKPERWDECVEQLQSFCEENNIIFEEVYQNYNQVVVQDYELSFSLQADITPYVADMASGMVMMRKGAEPKAIRFGSFEYMQMEIKRYFKSSSPNPVL